MASTKTCPECGTPFPSDSPGASCPACLMRLGLPEDGGPGQMAHGAATEMHTPGPGMGLPSMDELGRSLPQFTFERLLGQGGMGAVYKARQKSLDRDVAIKIIKPAAALHAGFAERFSREARALAQLSHQSIVTIHDFGEIDGLYYFVMEYIDGVDLREAMRQGGIAPEQALAIVPQICEALQYAHEEGVVHRDIKPENILLDKRGRVKIADFGLAKLLGHGSLQTNLTATHQVMGTMHYMAPEQIERPAAVDHRADIYSLGVVLYELMTGELPLGRFALPSERELDARLDEVVLKTLDREPDRRFQGASELKTAVEHISAGAGPVTPPPRPRGQEPSPVSSPPQFTPGGYPAEAPHDVRVSAQRGARTFPNPGLIAMGAIMAAVGFGSLVLGLKYDGHGFMWAGLGVALGGFPVAAGAWSEGQRVRAGTRPNPEALMMGLAMLLVGVGLLVTMVILERVNDGEALLWVGFGLAIGGGGCLAGTWKGQEDEEEDEENGVSEKPQPSPGKPPKPDAPNPIVRARLKGPATALLILGFLYLAILLIFVVGLVLSIVNAGLVFGGDAGPVGTMELLIIFAIAGLPTTVLAAFFLLGGYQMLVLRSYGVAMTAAILALIPIGLLWWISLPIGIWALRVMGDAEVRGEFVKEHLPAR